MVWARFDDKYSESPKVEAAGAWAELLDMRAIIYCCRNETDGHVSAIALAKISAGIPQVKVRAARLVEVGRWAVNDIGGGWFIHDFLVYNPSKAQLQDQRNEGKERARRSREAKENATRTYGRSGSVPHARARGTGNSEENCEDVKSPPPWIAFGMTRAEWNAQNAANVAREESA